MDAEIPKEYGTCANDWCSGTGKPWNDGLCDMCCDDYLIYDTGRYFKIESWKRRAPEEVECARCGNRKFSVAVDSYYTAIRCDECGWEACIHSG